MISVTDKTTNTTAQHTVPSDIHTVVLATVDKLIASFGQEKISTMPLSVIGLFVSKYIGTDIHNPSLIDLDNSKFFNDLFHKLNSHWPKVSETGLVPAIDVGRYNIDFQETVSEFLSGLYSQRSFTPSREGRTMMSSGELKVLAEDVFGVVLDYSGNDHETVDEEGVKIVYRLLSKRLSVEYDYYAEEIQQRRGRGRSRQVNHQYRDHGREDRPHRRSHRDDDGRYSRR